MTEEEYRRADIRAKNWQNVTAIVGAVAVVVSILIGLGQIVGQTKAQADAINNQWKQQFYEERLILYRRATEAAGRVAALKVAGAGGEEAESAWIEFRTLYWGPMGMTEGPDVERAMVFFNNAVEKDKDADTLQQLALRLAHVAKNETSSVYLGERGSVSHYGSNEAILAQMKELAGIN